MEIVKIVLAIFAETAYLVSEREKITFHKEMMMMDVLHEKILEMRVTSLEEEKAFLQQERMKCLSLFAKIIMACEATNGCVSMSANSEQHFCLRVSGRGQTVFEKTFPMDEVNMHTLPDILMDLFAQEETTWKIS